MKMKKKMILLVSLLLLTAAVLGGMPQDAWADTQSKEYVVCLLYTSDAADE